MDTQSLVCGWSSPLGAMSLLGGSLGPYPHSEGYGRGGRDLFWPSCAWALEEDLSGQIHRPQSPLPTG